MNNATRSIDYGRYQTLKITRRGPRDAVLDVQMRAANGKLPTAGHDGHWELSEIWRDAGADDSVRAVGAAFVDVLVPEMPIGLARADTALLRTVERRVARATRVVPLVAVRAFATAEAFEEALRATLATSGGVVVSTYGDLARRPAFWAALGRAFPSPPAPTSAQ